MIFRRLMLLPWMLLSVAAMAEQTIRLKVGETFHLPVAENTQIMIADETVLSGRLVGTKQLLLKGKSQGYSDLWLINETATRWRVTVAEVSDPALMLKLKDLTGREPNLTTESLDNFVIVKGDISAAGALILAQLEETYPQLLDQTTTLMVDQPMLRLSVKILEIKRQQLRELGIDWQTTTSGPTAATAIKGMFRWSAQIDSTLNLLQQQGQAELLASPTLSAQSGESATFLAGGELPIPQVLAQGMQDVSFREYGIKLIIEPEITATGKIKTRLSAEVSNIDPAVTVAGVPGILSRRTDSIFLSREGDTLVLSGLLSHEKSHSESATPGLQKLPLLGQLFQSQQHREQQTELLIMVTTERLDAAQRRIDEQQQRYFEQQQWLRQAGCSGLKEKAYVGY
ncbi:pilus assembly protein CpaC [Idiomarina seosinensis]|uniref:type II and III secretion system protein family protein n=1 Tax=Idiomarina seosinensis TaxID=281739 RepID=UPI00384F22A6